MTNEEAIKVLNMVEAHGLADEAKRMAIEALKVSEIPTGSKGGDAEMRDPSTPNPYMQHSPDSGADLISRQDALDAIERKAYRHTYIDQIIGIIDSLPTAEPKKGEWVLSHIGTIL